jgi:hypothetical protein
LVKRCTAEGEDLGKSWESKEVLVQDAVGPVYAERGGLFGILHDTYGKSTYDRLRVKASLEHSLDRLNLFAKRTDVSGVGGISYDKGFPVAVNVEEMIEIVADYIEEPTTLKENGEQVSEPIQKPKRKASSERGRSRTPTSRKKNDKAE